MIRINAIVVAALCTAMLVGVAVEVSDAGSRRRENRIEEARYTVEDKIKSVAKASAVRDEIKKHFNLAKAAYEKAHNEVESLTAELIEVRKEAAAMSRQRVDLVQHIKEQLDQLPEVKEATANVKKATEHLNAVKTKVLKPLTSTPKYQAVSKQLQDMSSRITALQQDPESDAQEKAALRLQAAKVELELNAMVSAALAKSEEYGKAKSQLDAAEQQLERVREQHAAELKNNSSRVAADTAVTDLRKKQADLSRRIALARRAEAKAKPRYAVLAQRLAKAEKELEFQQTLLEQAEDLLRDARAGG